MRTPVYRWQEKLDSSFRRLLRRASFVSAHTPTFQQKSNAQRFTKSESHCFTGVFTIPYDTAITNKVFEERCEFLFRKKGCARYLAIEARSGRDANQISTAARLCTSFQRACPSSRLWRRSVLKGQMTEQTIDLTPTPIAISVFQGRMRQRKETIQNLIDEHRKAIAELAAELGLNEKLRALLEHVTTTTATTGN